MSLRSPATTTPVVAVEEAPPSRLSHVLQTGWRRAGAGAHAHAHAAEMDVNAKFTVEIPRNMQRGEMFKTTLPDGRGVYVHVDKESVQGETLLITVPTRQGVVVDITMPQGQTMRDIEYEPMTDGTLLVGSVGGNSPAQSKIFPNDAIVGVNDVRSSEGSKALAKEFREKNNLRVFLWRSV